MTLPQLLALMATMQCHTMVVDIPEQRESIVQTVCVRIQVQPLKEETKPVAPLVAKKKVVRYGCKKRWYWKNGHKRYRCIR